MKTGHLIRVNGLQKINMDLIFNNDFLDYNKRLKTYTTRGKHYVTIESIILCNRKHSIHIISNKWIKAD